MLRENERINLKSDLHDWLEYELCEKYGKKDSISCMIKDMLKLSEDSLLRYHIKCLRKI